MTTFDERIKELRKQRGLTQRQMTKDHFKLIARQSGKKRLFVDEGLD